MIREDIAYQIYEWRWRYYPYHHEYYVQLDWDLAGEFMDSGKLESELKRFLEYNYG